MAHNKKFGEFFAAVVAAGNQTITSTALVASSINATGYDRATFIFQMGTASATSAALSSGNIIYNASTSGATYAAIAGASFGTNIAGTITNANYVIDVNVNPSKPWLKVSAFNINTAHTYSVMCILRTPQNAPPTTLSGQMVYVD